MTRRRGEPDPLSLIRFIADNESLANTLDEFPQLTDDRLREVLRDFVKASTAPPKKRRPKTSDEGEGSLRVVVNTDGASRGNPGPSGGGWVVFSLGGERIHEGHAFLGRRTNNEAEYEAVIGGLMAAAKLGATEVTLRSDSELLIRQINGRYRVKNPRLLKLYEAARQVIQRFRRFEARHVPRADNAAADALANRAIDEEGPDI